MIMIHRFYDIIKSFSKTFEDAMIMLKVLFS